MCMVKLTEITNNFISAEKDKFAAGNGIYKLMPVSPNFIFQDFFSLAFDGF